MKLLDRIRSRPPRVEAGDPDSTGARSAHEQQVPIDGFDQLDGEQVVSQLSQLSQVELAAVEAYERSYRKRSVVLNRLRWLRGSEPLPGYDALDSNAIARALADADAATVRAVRSYERHHRDRREVRAEAARVLPSAPASAGQDRARDEKAALVQAGLRSGPRSPHQLTPTGLTAMKTDSHRGSFDRVDAAREERNERERLRDEARYRRERLDLDRARLYGGRAASQAKLKDLQRASDGAAARLRRADARAEAEATPTHQPT